MKKLVCILLVILLVGSLSDCGNSTLKYPIGPDTYRVFGDGTFQTGGTDTDQECLSFEKYGILIMQNVTYIHETGDKVYVFGYDYRDSNKALFKIYAILSLEEGKIWVCTDGIHDAKREFIFIKEEEMVANGDLVRVTDFSDFSEQDRTIFETMLSGTTEDRA